MYWNKEFVHQVGKKKNTIMTKWLIARFDVHTAIKKGKGKVVPPPAMQEQLHLFLTLWRRNYFFFFLILAHAVYKM